MNWYNKFRQAAPVATIRDDEYYTGIGHDYPEAEKAELWLITKDWNLLTVPTEEAPEHGMWNDFLREQWSLVASGRYIDGVATAVVQCKGLSPSAEEYRTNKVVYMLDNHYNNPEIKIFD